MKQSPPWFLIASLIASGSLATFVNTIETALPAQAKLIANIAAVLVAGAGLVVSYYQAASAPAQAIVKDAPVVNTDGTPTGATNVSSSSTLLK